MTDNTTEKKKEIAIAIAVVQKGTNRQLVKEHLDELEFLAETAGAEIIAKIVQELPRKIPATAIGSGKVQEVKELIEESQATCVIFDDDLAPMQVRNLEKELEVKILDRSGLILDIFASRARTVEAKTQVELAQLQYMLPRLTRMWTHLSKQYGGVGTKGPGETQIETDRRLIRDRINRLEEKMETIDIQKEQQRKGRELLHRFALIGYTNSGKSTLMNALTNADVYAENKLFATLDTTVRSLTLPGGQHVLLSDTVGFIRKLPTHLVASFKSTLYETIEADTLIHVVDISNPAFREHIETVEKTLSDIAVHSHDTILVFNKIDAVADPEILHALELEFPNCVLISAQKKLYLDVLLQKMKESFERQSALYTVAIPYAQSNIIGQLYDAGEVIERHDTDEAIVISIRTTQEKRDWFRRKFEQFLQ